jgi:hypothetical protein
MGQFAAMTGVHYETARHWGRTRSGCSQAFPCWVPPMLEMMNPTVSERPPNEAMHWPRPKLTETRALRHDEKSGVTMNNNTDISEYYKLVIRRGAPGHRPFVWEIRHKATAQMPKSSAVPFVTMDEAHRSGLSALTRLIGEPTVRKQ